MRWNYEEFYKTELKLRKSLKYPPFCDIILIKFDGKNLREIQTVSNKIYLILNEILDKSKIVLFKPVPSPIDKIQNKYRYRIILKGKVTGRLLDCIKYAIDQNEKIKDTSIVVDINPNNMI